MARYIISGVLIGRTKPTIFEALYGEGDIKVSKNLLRRMSIYLPKCEYVTARLQHRTKNTLKLRRFVPKAYRWVDFDVFMDYGNGIPYRHRIFYDEYCSDKAAIKKALNAIPKRLDIAKRKKGLNANSPTTLAFQLTAGDEVIGYWRKPKEM